MLYSVTTMYLISVSRTYSNVSKRAHTRYKPKTLQVAFYVLEGGSVRSVKLSKIKFYYLKYFVKKWRKRKFVCSECGYVFQALIKNKKDVVDCPKCL